MLDERMNAHSRHYRHIATKGVVGKLKFDQASDKAALRRCPDFLYFEVRKPHRIVSFWSVLKGMPGDGSRSRAIRHRKSTLNSKLADRTIVGCSRYSQTGRNS